MKIAYFTLLPLHSGLVNGSLGIMNKALCIEGDMVEFHKGQLLTFFLLFTFDESKEVFFVIVDEIENQARGVLKLNEQALLLTQIASLYNVCDFNQRPVFFNRLMLGQYKRCKLKMRVFLEGRDVFKSISLDSYLSFSF